MAAILLVEDDADTCEMVARFLRAEGHRVTCAAHGAEALEALRAFRPDLVILDLMMPVMDGAQFLRVVRSDRAYSDLPVVLLSASSESARLGEALALGVTRHFVKGTYYFQPLLELLVTYGE